MSQGLLWCKHTAVMPACHLTDNCGQHVAGGDLCRVSCPSYVPGTACSCVCTSALLKVTLLIWWCNGWWCCSLQGRELRVTWAEPQTRPAGDTVRRAGGKGARALRAMSTRVHTGLKHQHQPGCCHAWYVVRSLCCRQLGVVSCGWLRVAPPNTGTLHLHLEPMLPARPALVCCPAPGAQLLCTSTA